MNGCYHFIVWIFKMSLSMASKKVLSLCLGIQIEIGVEFAEPPGDRLPVCGSKPLPALLLKDNFPRVAPGIALATAGER